MSTEMCTKTNQCYSISAVRFYGGKENGVMARFEINDTEQTTCIALKKKDVIDFCAEVIRQMNVIG